MRTTLALSAMAIDLNRKVLALAMALSIATIALAAVVASAPHTYLELRAEHLEMMAGYVVPLELRPPYPGLETLRVSARRSPQMIERIMEVQERRWGTP